MTSDHTAMTKFEIKLRSAFSMKSVYSISLPKLQVLDFFYQSEKNFKIEEE